VVLALALLSALLPALLPMPAAAGQQGPLLLSAAGEARLELPSGERVAAPLPAGASLETTAALETGWLAAGTQPGAGDSRGGRDLLLLTGGPGRTVSALPSPPGQPGQTAGTLRQEPLPLVSEGRLAGLAWLEGETRRSLGVRFAAWNGAGWETPQTVAPPGPGSQLALTAARLPDGSWLLAWSAFDGRDDEIVWSRSRDGAWSRPRRAAADNAVPDITPALTVVGDTALLAWSRYDAALGQYRVVVSRFQGTGTWSPPVAAGPPGSRYPTFEPAPAGTARLLYRAAAPGSWEVLDLDRAGRATRQATVTTASAAESARPVVRSASGSDGLAGGVTFRWPAAGTERTAAWGTRGTERKP
jgi:hypothetical protein